MNAGKIIAYIVAAILILFGVLMMIAGTNPVEGQGIWIPVGLVLVAIGLVLIFWAARRPAQPGNQNVTLNIDLPGNVNMDSLKCKSCGGVLGEKDIKMVAGAPVVTCPYCGTVYQLTEEPKW